MGTFKLVDISKYRRELFGCATICILAVHSIAHQSNLPKLLSTVQQILGFGTIGVDIFLLLSGLGLFYSLSKNKDTKAFYSRRLIRIFIPYLLIAIPVYTWKYFFIAFKPMQFIFQLSTFSFWFQHNGAWYVSLIIPLYLLFPLLYRSVYKNKHPFVIILIEIIGLMAVLQLLEWTRIQWLSDNVCWAFMRGASFLMGCYLGRMAKENKRYRIIYAIGASVLVLLFLQVCFKVLSSLIVFRYLQYTLIAMLFCVIVTLFFNFNKIRKVNQFFCFLGDISLEMYLWNIFLIDILSYYRFPQLCGYYIYYLIVIVAGILLSVLSHKLSVWITNIINNSIRMVA